MYAGGVDSCTCCGTHCERAGEVGLLKIQSHTNYKGGTRIYFNCGMRAVISMQQDNARMDTIARRFSTSADRAVNAVIKQGDELADIKRSLSGAQTRFLPTGPTSFTPRPTLQRACMPSCILSRA